MGAEKRVEDEERILEKGAAGQRLGKERPDQVILPRRNYWEIQGTGTGTVLLRHMNRHKILHGAGGLKPGCRQTFFTTNKAFPFN